MSKLQTNFKDDILDEEMNGKRRVKLTPLPDGTYIIEDVTKYIQVGSEYGQKEINQLNETVNDKLDSEKVIDDLNTALAVTENGVPVGCKAISELNSNLINIIGIATQYVSSNEFNINANSAGDATFTIPERDGYTPVLLFGPSNINGIASGSYIYAINTVRRLGKDAKTNALAFRNISSVATGLIIVGAVIVYVRDDMFAGM